MSLIEQDLVSFHFKVWYGILFTEFFFYLIFFKEASHHLFYFFSVLINLLTLMVV